MGSSNPLHESLNACYSKSKNLEISRDAIVSVIRALGLLIPAIECGELSPMSHCQADGSKDGTLFLFNVRTSIIFSIEIFSAT